MFGNSAHHDVITLRQARLPEIVKLAKQYDALTMVDDAHGEGVLGQGGRGVVNHFNLEGEVDIEIGSLSKVSVTTLPPPPLFPPNLYTFPLRSGKHVREDGSMCARTLVEPCHPPHPTPLGSASSR